MPSQPKKTNNKRAAASPRRPARRAAAARKPKPKAPAPAAASPDKSQAGPAPAPTAAPSQPYYDSMQSAAAGMGLDKGLLQRAKKAGCPGFIGSRVYPDKVLPWIEAHPEVRILDDKESLEKALLQVKLDRAQFEFETEQEKWLKKVEVDEWLETRIQQARSLLEQQLTNTLPPKLQGLTAVQMIVLFKELIVDVIKALRGLAKQEVDE